jgi:hypothetical protein
MFNRGPMILKSAEKNLSHLFSCVPGKVGVAFLFDQLPQLPQRFIMLIQEKRLSHRGT